MTDVARTLADAGFDSGVNLDCCPSDTLLKFSGLCASQPEAVHLSLWPKRNLSGRTIGFLHDYARAKIRSVRARERGAIELALQYESECERIYNALPRYARW